MHVFKTLLYTNEGLGEWDPAPGFKIVHTPGHTPGSMCILIETSKDKVLFTGDSLAYSKGKQRLEGFKRYNKGDPLDVLFNTLSVSIVSYLPN